MPGDPSALPIPSPEPVASHDILPKGQGWVLALVLGALGFVLNGYALENGWGLDFLMGGAIAYSGLRLLSPMQIVVAVSLSASRTIWLWEHPWAWLVWTIEAALLAVLPKRTSPVRNDVLFWLFAGTPLLWVTYGLIMEMDGSSLALLILKHGINGVINVTLGEMIYTGVLMLWGQHTFRNLPPITIDSAILALMVSVASLPAVLWLRIDAPHRESWIRSLTEARLTEGYQDIEQRLKAWRVGGSDWLASSTNGETALNPNFTSVSRVQRNGRWLNPTPGATDSAVYGPLATEAPHEPQLVTRKTTESDQPQLALASPLDPAKGEQYVIAHVRPGIIERVFRPASIDPGFSGALLVGPGGTIGARFGTIEAQWLQDEAVKAFPDGRTVEVNPPRQFGTSPMNASRDTVFVTARPTQAFPGWKVVLISHARNAIIAEREAQLRIMLALAGLIVALTIIASGLADRSRRMLDRMAQSLTDLALLGGEPEQMRRAFITELGDISSRIAQAGSSMQKQRLALLTNRRRLQVIIEHGGLVIYTIDTTRPKSPNLTFITPSIDALLGYQQEEVFTHDWLPAHLHPDDMLEPPVFSRAFKPGAVITREYRLRHKLGHYVWVHDCLVIDDHGDGLPGEAVGFIIDISDRKAATEKLTQAGKMESLGRMAAGVAHELNQPLNFISLASQNLYKRFARGDVDPAYATDKIERILSQVKRAAMIVGQVRTFGRSVTETSPVIAVGDVVADVASLLKGQLDLKGVTLKCLPTDPALQVRVHPVRLGQVLINLVINARDSILQRREDGRPTPGTITMSAHHDDGWVEIAVEDTGTGIAPDKLAMLFEPFFTTKSPQEGTGLGLSVSYGIIAEVGGSIRAENTADGARFIVRLPVPNLTLPNMNEAE